MRTTSYITLATLLLLASSGTNAQTVSSSGSPMVQSWETAEWNGDDAPFARERKLLENASVAQLEVLLHKGRAWPSNFIPLPLDWFRYGTATYVLTTKWKHDVQNDLMHAIAWSGRISAPATPTFARLQFLLQARGIPHPDFKSIGLRLAQRDPRDYDVRYYLCNSLMPDQIPANKPLALRLCDQMQRLAPNRPSAYSAQGSIYFRCWLARRSGTDRQKSITAYNRFLQLASKNDPFRPQAQRLIAMMNAKR